MNMERGFETFGEDPISLEQITENLKRQDGKIFVGDALEKSLQSIESLPTDNNKALVLGEITDLLLDSDLIYLAKRFGEEALDSIEGIKTTAEKAKTLSRIASIFADYEFKHTSEKIFAKAWEEAERIEDEGKRVQVFLSIIEDQLDRNLNEKLEKNLDEVLSKALHLSEGEHDILPLAMTAETMAKIKGKKAEEICNRVLEYANNLELEDDHGWIIGSVAKAFSRIGKHEKSMELMRKLISKSGSDIPLVEVAITLSEEGQTERALELKDYVDNEELKDSLMGVIAADLINREFIDEALNLKKDIKDEFETDLLLKNLIRYYAPRDREKAMMYLQDISSLEMKALGYSELAKSHLQEDGHRRAKELALKALDMIVDAKSESIKLELIETLMEVGLEDKAIELAEDITSSEERAIAFGSIAASSY